MKHFTLLTLATLFVASAAAQSGKIRRATPVQRPVAGTVVKNVPAAKAALRATVRPKDVQNARPEGTVYDTWTYAAHVYYLNYFGEDAWQEEMDMSGSEGLLVVSADESAIWVYNPLGAWLTYSYMRLDKSAEEDGVYVARFPQDIFEERYTPDEWYETTGETIERDTVFTYTLMRVVAGQTEYNGELLDDMVPDETQEVRFAWDGTSLRQIDDVQIGAMDDDGLYAGFGAQGIVLAAIADELATPPAGAETLPYTLTYDNAYGGVERRLANVAFAGDDVYLSGLHSVNVEGWAKGKKEQGADGKTYVTFSSPQYLGLDAAGGYHVYFIAGTAEKFYDETHGYYDWNYEFGGNFVFELDTEKRTLTATKANAAIYINSGTESLSTYAIITNPVLAPYSEGAATPADPTIDEDYYYPYDASLGYGSITFYIPAADVDGNYIDTDKLFYRIYLDDDIMTFSPEDYGGLPGVVNYLSYAYADYDAVYAYDDYHQLIFFETGFDRIGVQSFYRGGGEERASNIVYIGEDDTAILTPATAGSCAGAVYDLQGRRTAATAKGIYIVNGKKILK